MEPLTRGPRQTGEVWSGRPAPSRRYAGGGGLSPGWALAGLALVGLGFLAWRSFGPDLVRYMKIRSM
jgi:hypothetical protein